MAVIPGRVRSLLRLGLLVFTAVVLITLDFRGYEPLSKAQIAVRDIMFPIVRTGNSGLEAMSNVWAATFGGSHLRRINKELQTEIDRLRGDTILSEADREAYRQLREATDINYYTDDIERLTASVLRNGTGNFRDNEIVIDKGHRDGLISGMTVVTGAGLVGIISAVGADYSTVTTVSDPELIISVQLVDTGEIGLGHGATNDHTQFVVDTGLRWPENDPETHLAGIGSGVVTAATSRYPANIPIGHLQSVESATAGLMQVVTVKLAVNTQDVSFVTVLLEEPGNPLPTGPDSPFTTVIPQSAQG